MSTRGLVLLFLLLLGCERSIVVGRLASDGQTMDDNDASDGDAGDGSTFDADAGDPCPPFHASRISAGEHHVCAISSGKVYCWGAGQAGQIGNAETDDQSLPTPIAANGTFTNVTTMTYGSCAQRTDGMLLCFGENFAGGLANGGTQNDSSPNETIDTAVEFVGGQSFMLTRSASGLLTVWGDNQYDKLGLGDIDDAVLTETPVPGSNFVHLAAGAHHACATAPSGFVHCAGDNVNHQLGIPGGERNVFTLVTDTLVFDEIEAGLYTTCGITTGDLLYCWGRNDPVYVVGAGPSLMVPTLAPLTRYEHVSVGFDTVCVLRDGGYLYCWGAGDHYALGQPDDLEDQPEPIHVLKETRFTAVSVGRDFGCAIRMADNAVVCWGDNANGQLGRGASTTVEPEVVCAP